MGNAVIINSNVVNSPYTATLRSGLSVTGGETTLSSATVSDLTSGRVVLAGSSGALQDNSNLTFTGTQLNVTGNVSATEFHTGASGSAIRITSNTISGPATFTLDPAAVGDNTGKVIIAGDLQVDGTTTTVNSTTVNIVDKNIQVATGSANDAAANGGGITIASGDGNKTFQFEATGDNLGSSENLNLASGKDYKINNTSVLNATTLGSGVVNSSLTSVGTLTSLDVSGLVGIGSLTVAGVSTFSNNIDVNGNADISGNLVVGGTINSGDNITITKGIPTLHFVDTNANDFQIRVNNNLFTIRDTTNSSANRFMIDGGGNVTINEKLFVFGDTNLSGHAGIGSITVAGIGTFNSGIFVPDDKKIEIGNTAGSGDIQIYWDGASGFLTNQGGGNFHLNSDSTLLKNAANTKSYLRAYNNGPVELYFNNTKRIETTNTGAIVTGILTATGGFSGNLTGNVTGNADTATLATDLAINGTNQLLYQASNNDSAILPTGNPGQILQSNGAGSAPQWVTSAPAGAIEGITIREESSVVGSANSISTINFIGQSVTADAAVAAGIATVTIDAISGMLVKEDEANVGTAITAFDFSGSLVDVDAASNSGIATVQIDGLTIKDEGSTVGTAGSITTINFVGTGIAAAVSGGTATITAAGGGATQDDVVALAIALG